MSDKPIKCFLANNFVIEDRVDLPTRKDYLERPDVMLDERTYILSHNVDRTNWNWYFNYINSIRVLAQKNYNSPANNILDLGFVPLIYLPSCMLFMESELFRILDVTGVPYTKLHKTSFTFSKVDLQGADAWISKMDAAELLGCKPVDVTSEMCIRRLLLNA